MKNLLIVFLLLLLSGCHLRRSAAPPRLSGLQLSVDQRAAIKSKLRERTSRINSLRALSRTRMEHGRRKEKLRQIFAFDRPDKLLVELLPPGAAYALNILIIRGASLVFLDNTNKEAFEGRSSKSLMEETIGIPLEPLDLMDHLIGAVPARYLSEGSEGDFSAFQESDQLLFVSKDRSWVAIFDPQSLELKNFQKRNSGGKGLIYEINYEEYTEVKGFKVPKRIELYLAGKRLRILLLFTAHKINDTKSKHIYKLRVPSDYRMKIK